jgi:hypothetical protein
MSGALPPRPHRRALQELTYKTLDERKRVPFTSSSAWLGFTDKYWAAVLAPDKAAPLHAEFARDRLSVPSIRHFEPPIPSLRRGRAMVDMYGTPHTEALHVVERYQAARLRICERIGRNANKTRSRASCGPREYRIRTRKKSGAAASSLPGSA